MNRSDCIYRLFLLCFTIKKVATLDSVGSFFSLIKYDPVFLLILFIISHDTIHSISTTTTTIKAQHYLVFVMESSSISLQLKMYSFLYASQSVF